MTSTQLDEQAAVGAVIAWVHERYRIAPLQTVFDAQLLLTNPEGWLVQVMLGSNALVTVWVTQHGEITPISSRPKATEPAGITRELTEQCQAAQAAIGDLLAAMDQAPLRVLAGAWMVDALWDAVRMGKAAQQSVPDEIPPLTQERAVGQ